MKRLLLIGFAACAFAVVPTLSASGNEAIRQSVDADCGQGPAAMSGRSATYRALSG
jgi:hypothetical protein